MQYKIIEVNSLTLKWFQHSSEKIICHSFLQSRGDTVNILPLNIKFVHHHIVTGDRGVDWECNCGAVHFECQSLVSGFVGSGNLMYNPSLTLFMYVNVPQKGEACQD